MDLKFETETQVAGLTFVSIRRANSKTPPNVVINNLHHNILNLTGQKEKPCKSVFITCSSALTRNELIKVFGWVTDSLSTISTCDPNIRYKPLIRCNCREPGKIFDKFLLFCLFKNVLLLSIKIVFVREGDWGGGTGLEESGLWELQKIQKKKKNLFYCR